MPPITACCWPAQRSENTKAHNKHTQACEDGDRRPAPLAALRLVVEVINTALPLSAQGIGTAPAKRRAIVQGFLPDALKRSMAHPKILTLPTDSTLVMVASQHLGSVGFPLLAVHMRSSGICGV